MSAQARLFRERMLEARLAPSTIEVYTRALQEVRAGGFPVSYAGLLEYFAVTASTRSVGQLRTVKCAALFASRVSGAEIPITAEQAKDLDMVLQGAAVVEAERRREPLRGSLDADQLEQIVDLAHEQGLTDIGDGFVVLFGIGCRPRDIAELTAQSVDLHRQTVLVRPKRRRYLRAAKGDREEHPIRTAGARLLLFRRCAKKAQGPLFSGWSTARASRVVKEAARRYAWPTSVKWDGAHCVRHAAAGAELEKALRLVQTAGGWSTPQSAAHYSRSNAARRVQN